MLSNKEIEQIIIKNEYLLKDALINSDTEVLNSLLDDSLVFTIRKVDMTKEDYLKSNPEYKHRVYRSDFCLQVFKKITETTVDIDLWVDIKARFCGTEFEGKYKYIHTWKLCEDNKYRLISGTIKKEEENKIPLDK